jgi:peptidoglycan hydrolase-like protein with peptidoglycan-binding domain
MLWKNKYNSSDKISLLQRERPDREFLKHKRDGFLERETRRAIRKFQKSRGIPATGRIDAEPEIMHSKSRVSPEIYPQEIK